MQPYRGGLEPGYKGCRGVLEGRATIMGSKESQRRGAARVQRTCDGPMVVLRLVVELGRGRSSGLRREGGGAATGQGYRCGDTAGLGEEMVSGLRGDGVWHRRRTGNGAGTRAAGAVGSGSVWSWPNRRREEAAPRQQSRRWTSTRLPPHAKLKPTSALP
jgi:hypothetical protein